MKLKIKSVAPVSDDVSRRNVANAKRLGFPRLGKAETPRLAGVGGGTSIRDHVEELRAFDGDIWAINGAFHWCQEHGIDAWFYSVDPSDLVVPFCSGAKRAIVAMDSHPDVFEALAGADVEAIDMDGLAHGPSSSTSAPIIGGMRGYRDFSFFGCEGSFVGTTHAYGDYSLEMLLRVKCNGETFLTSADMVVQVEYLGEIMLASPSLKDRSGGLLAAYLIDPNIDVLAASPCFYQEIVQSQQAAT
jgi:hypothetical protein